MQRSRTVALAVLLLTGAFSREVGAYFRIWTDNAGRTSFAELSSYSRTNSEVEVVLKDPTGGVRRLRLAEFCTQDVAYVRAVMDATVDDPFASIVLLPSQTVVPTQSAVLQRAATPAQQVDSASPPPIRPTVTADEQKEWQARTADFERGGMSANGKRAYTFEKKLVARKQAVQTRALEAGVVLPLDRLLSAAEQMARTKYRRGSMPPRDMDSYEQAQLERCTALEAPVVAAERAAKQKWRQEHPLEARLEDVEAAVSDARSAAGVAAARAEEAQWQARRATTDAQAAQRKAAEADNRARDLERKTWELEQR